MKVAIIGCGLIGQKRANNLSNASLVVCCDENLNRAEQLAAQFEHCVAVQGWQKAIEHPGVDVVIIATPHNSLAQLMRAAIVAGKHVLVEKPAARHVSELIGLPGLAQKHRVRVRVGFNHRYHRAFQQARKIVDAGSLGELMFLRARYGHGGRIGYDKEWRSRPELSGGGELIDQGVHLIDLARWFLGDFETIDGYAKTFFWDMPVDDNAFMQLKTASKQVAFMHASCTEWKNTFSWELYGQAGKLHIEGLGGSYGTEKLTWYKMLPEMGPPVTTSWEYPMADNSWAVEMDEFLQDLNQGRNPCPGLDDAIAALHVVDHIYKESGYAHHP
jgi:predicted dehydrogenase